jgi:hypothetical protein
MEKIKELEESLENYRNLISFLAKAAIEGYEVALEMCSFDTGDEVRNHFSKYPIIQGFSTQKQLKKIGKMPIDYKKATIAANDILSVF